MAVVNFTNLATARASQRAREVALRKVLGANRRQLIIQFVGESILISAASMLLALALVELLVKPFAAFLEADLVLRYFGEGGILLPAIGLVLLVGVLGGLYPAFFLSRFQPAQVLKANRSAAETPGSGRLRTALVVLQFAVSIGLIVCTAVIYGQTVYARSVDPGFKRDHIIQVDEFARAQLWEKGEMIVDTFRRVPGVVAVGRTDIGVATDNNNNTGLLPPGASQMVTIGQYNVDEGFFDAMGLTMKAGRWFDPNRPMDDMTTPYPTDEEFEKRLAARGVNVVLNEYAKRAVLARHRRRRHPRHRRRRRQPLPHRSPADRPDHVPQRQSGAGMGGRPLQRRSGDGPRRTRAGVEEGHQRGAVQCQVQRGYHRRGL
jgi:putative ABC transport system permease protein